MMGLEPTAYALEGHCSFHLRYIPICVSISCMPTFKALTQRNTYGYFYFCRASASYLLVGSYPTTSERKDSNLQSGSRCCFPCTRHFYQLSYVPKPPSDGSQSYLSCHALHYPCAFMENRWVRICTSHDIQ